jgi:hypothetical protein
MMQSSGDGAAGTISRVGNLVVARPSRRGPLAAPQDEVLMRGSISDPYGEEARSAVSGRCSASPGEPRGPGQRIYALMVRL